MPLTKASALLLPGLAIGFDRLGLVGAINKTGKQ